MSAEVGRRGGLHKPRGSKKGRSGLRDSAGAISSGPFSYGGAAAIGFVVGSISFLIGDAILSPHPGALQELPVFLFCSGGGAIFLAAAAIAANYIIGRKIRAQRELARTSNRSHAEFLQNRHFRDESTV